MRKQIRDTGGIHHEFFFTSVGVTKKERRKNMLESFHLAKQFCRENLEPFYKEQGEKVYENAAVKTALTGELIAAGKRFIAEHDIKADISMNMGAIANTEYPYDIVIVNDKEVAEEDAVEKYRRFMGKVPREREKYMIAGISVFTPMEDRIAGFMANRSGIITEKYPNLKLAFFDIIDTSHMTGINDKPEEIVLEEKEPEENISGEALEPVRWYRVYPEYFAKPNGEEKIREFYGWVFRNIPEDNRKKEDGQES